MNWRSYLLSILILGAAASGVRASVIRHDFDLSLDDTPETLVVGSSFSGTLTLTAGSDQRITSIDLSSPGWSARLLDAPGAGTMAAGETWKLAFEAMPLSEDQPLRLRVQADSGAHDFDLGLTPRRLRESKVRHAMQSSVTGADAGFGPRGVDPVPALVRADVDAGRTEKVIAEANGTPRTIRVHGAVVYDRVDGARMGAFGLFVDVYDLDLIGSNLLGTWACGYDGSFDFEVVFNETVFDRNPDLEVRFRADTPAARIRPNGVLSSSYSWSEGPWNDFGGTDLNLGTLIPLSADDHPVLHILNSISRAQGVLLLEGQGMVPQVTVVYPDNTWPHYDPNFQRIHLPRDFDDDPADPNNGLLDFQWRENTQIHEYGHHVTHRWADVGAIDYCNNRCDIGSCGHCLFCAETPEVAWSEGWVQWFSEYVTLQFPTLAGDTAYWVYDFEPSADCGTAPEITWVPPMCECSGWDTEGVFASLLHDIVDPVDTNGSDPSSFLTPLRNGRDDLELGSAAVWAASFGTGVQTPREFLDEFIATHAGQKEEIWFTAALNRYDLDGQRPGVVGSLTSTSHAIGSPTANSIVEMSWTPAPDDFSGIQGYNFVWGPAPEYPDTSRTFMDLEDVTSWTSPPSAPGDWYFSIVAFDNSGRRALGFASFGPITILPPDPANVTSVLRPGWGERVVPRPAADASANAVSMPTSLSPYPANTWLNLAAINEGELAAPQLDMWIYLDDFLVGSEAAIGLPPGQQWYWVNRGPFTAPPGRHILWTVADPLNLIFESDEFDNTYGVPWVWAPPTLARDDSVTAGRPGRATSGWASLPGPFVFTVYNADGYRMTSNNGFHAASLRALDDVSDYDLRLYTPSSGPTSGFFLYNAWSTAPAGALDVVVTNSATGGVRDYDLGVVNLHSGSNASYELTTHGAGSAAVGDSVAFALGAEQFLFLRQFSVSAADTGAVTVSLMTDPESGPWHLALFDPTTVQAELSSATWSTTANTAGACRLDLRLSEVGNYAFVAHRDPSGGTGATTVVYEIERTPPDLAAFTPAGWYASIVPRATDGPFVSLPAPASLPSDEPVFLYGASANLGPNGAPAAVTGVEVDGVSALSVSSSTLSSGATSITQFGTLQVGSGRHTLAHVLDRNSTVEETDETNNREAEQYVFRPRSLGTTPQVVEVSPPDRTGGLGDIPAGHPAYYNCDGWGPLSSRYQANDTKWLLASLMPPRAEDVDLRLHPASTSGTAGFAQVLTQSTWGVGQSEFAVFYTDSLGAGEVDLGVVALHSGNGYNVAAAGDSLLRWKLEDSTRWYEGLRLPSAWTAKLFSVEMPAGSYSVEVRPVGPSADLGVSVFVPDGSSWALAKGEESPGASSWLAAPEQPELALFDVDSRGLALIVVWKVGSKDLDSDQEFAMRISIGSSTGVPGPEPRIRRATITQAQPNPFNPRVEVVYRLPEPGATKLVVYDLRGHRVATLVDGVVGTGEQRARWLGVDDNGRSVSSGVYFLHLRGPGGVDTRKVVLAR